MRGWDGTAWKPARSFNGVWWNDLAYDQCYVANYGGAAGLVDSVPVGRSFTLIAKHNEYGGTYGRVGDVPAGRTRLMFYGDSANLRLRLVRAQNGADVAGSALEFLWPKVAGQTWSSAVYDGHTLKGSYNGDTRTANAPIAGFDDFAPSGTVPLRCETTYSATSNPIAVLVPGKLTQAQINQVIADFEASRTTKAPPALLAPVAPVANLGQGEITTLGLSHSLPRTIFFTSSTNETGCIMRNENNAIIDNRLGLTYYDGLSRAIYINRTGTQQFLDNPGRSWAMSAWWDGANAGLYSQNGGLTKQAAASTTPMPWRTGNAGTRLLAYNQRLPDDRIASLTHWLAWVER